MGKSRSLDTSGTFFCMVSGWGWFQLCTASLIRRNKLVVLSPNLMSSADHWGVSDAPCIPAPRDLPSVCCDWLSRNQEERVAGLATKRSRFEPFTVLSIFKPSQWIAGGTRLSHSIWRRGVCPTLRKGGLKLHSPIGNCNSQPIHVRQRTSAQDCSEISFRGATSGHRVTLSMIVRQYRKRNHHPHETPKEPTATA